MIINSYSKITFIVIALSLSIIAFSAFIPKANAETSSSDAVTQDMKNMQDMKGMKDMKDMKDMMKDMQGMMDDMKGMRCMQGMKDKS